MAQSPPGPPFYGLTPADGFHVLRNHWGDANDTEAQAGWLAREFQRAVDSTSTPDRAARGKNFRIADKAPARLDLDSMSVTVRERRLEQQLFATHGMDRLDATPRPAGVWRCLAGYQVPVYDRRARNRWGHVDLLGISQDGLPVTIELKVGDSNYSPFRALLEALANAVAVKAVWPSIAAEIATVSGPAGSKVVPLDATAETFAVQVLAPGAYWELWRPSRSGRTALTAAAREAVGQLRLVAGQTNFPVHFEALSEEAGDGFTFRDAWSEWWA